MAVVERVTATHTCSSTAVRSSERSASQQKLRCNLCHYVRKRNANSYINSKIYNVIIFKDMNETYKVFAIQDTPGVLRECRLCVPPQEHGHPHRGNVVALLDPGDLQPHRRISHRSVQGESPRGMTGMYQACQQENAAQLAPKETPNSNKDARRPQFDRLTDRLTAHVY